MKLFQSRSEHWPHAETYYARHLSKRQSFSPQEHALPDYAQVVIVGAGLAGLNTALGLLEQGVESVLVFDAGAIGSGASGRNGGFIMSGFSRSAEWLLKTQGLTRARVLYQQSLEAQQLVKDRIRHYQIDCDLTEEGILLTNWFQHSNALQNSLEAANRLGANWQYWPSSKTRKYINSNRYNDALYEISGGHCQPLAYTLGLARQIQRMGGRLFELSTVVGLNKIQKSRPAVAAGAKNWQVHVQQGEQQRQVSCSVLILACGGLQSSMTIKGGGDNRGGNNTALPITTFIGVTSPIEGIDELITGGSAVYDNRFAFDYYRKLPDQRLLWGGRISISRPSESTIKRRLKKDIVKVFPGLEECRLDYAWGGFMGYFRHQMPVAEPFAEYGWLINGFGGHGVAQTTLAAQLIVREVLSNLRNECAVATSSESGLLAFGRPYGFGWLGLLAAQSLYWRHQMTDFLRR